MVGCRLYHYAHVAFLFFVHEIKLIKQRFINGAFKSLLNRVGVVCCSLNGFEPCYESIGVVKLSMEPQKNPTGFWL